MIRDNKGRFVSEGKIWVTPKGYLMIWLNGKSKLLHEFIWEQHNNCEKPKGFFIHHKDKNKQNNSIENLELVNEQIHQRLHAGWVRDLNGNFVAKPCTKCKKILSLDKFYDRINYGIGYSNPSARCKKCHNL